MSKRTTTGEFTGSLPDGERVLGTGEYGDLIIVCTDSGKLFVIDRGVPEGELPDLIQLEPVPYTDERKTLVN